MPFQQQNYGFCPPVPPNHHFHQGHNQSFQQQFPQGTQQQQGFNQSGYNQPSFQAQGFQPYGGFNGQRRRGRGGRNNGGRRNRLPTGYNHYCWTCGACNHPSMQCPNPIPGHQNRATFRNRMNGNQNNCYN